MNTTATDCRSEVGITVGLIDGMIAIARVLKQRDLSSPEVRQALKDLRSDEDIYSLLNCQQNALTTQEEITPYVGVDAIGIWDLGMTVRTTRLLETNNIHYVGDYVRLPIHERRFQGFGKKAKEELQLAFKAKGISFKV